MYLKSFVLNDRTGLVGFLFGNNLKYILALSTKPESIIAMYHLKWR